MTSELSHEGLYALSAEPVDNMPAFGHQRHIWNVEIQIFGPVMVDSLIEMSQQKGWDPEDPFYSNIRLQRSPSGIRSMVTARAENEEVAYQAAIYFFGLMLDALCLDINLPLRVKLFDDDSVKRNSENQVRRIISSAEFTSAFRESRHLSQNYPAFLKCLSWFRKGMYTKDPYDRFLAFWNAIEHCASVYYQHVPGMDIEKGKSGAKNQIFGCFYSLWGDPKNCTISSDYDQWIKDNYNIRLGIAHGLKMVTIDEIQDVVSKIDPLKRMAYKFLVNWQQQMLSHTNPVIPPEPPQ